MGIKNSDIDFFDLITSSNKNFSIVLTKTDKCSIKFIKKQMASIFTLMKNYKKTLWIFLLVVVKKIMGY